MEQFRWGHTPRDDLDRDALLREVQRMYSAVAHMSSVLEILRTADLYSPFWQRFGNGGSALLKAHQVLDPIADTRMLFVLPVLHRR